MENQNYIELVNPRIFKNKRSLFKILTEREGSKKYILAFLCKDCQDKMFYITTLKSMAQPITLAIEKLEIPTQTFDIHFQQVLSNFEIELEYILIKELSKEGYYKSIAKYKNLEKKLEIEGRTVDLILIAIRNNKPIYIDKKLI